MSSDYSFVTMWRVPGTVEEVCAVGAERPRLQRLVLSTYPSTMSAYSGCVGSV